MLISSPTPAEPPMSNDFISTLSNKKIIYEAQELSTDGCYILLIKKEALFKSKS